MVRDVCSKHETAKSSKNQKDSRNFVQTLLRKIMHFRYILHFRSLSPRLLHRFASTASGETWPSSRVRRTFIDYFVSQGCTFVPSSSVIPADDRSLLYVNAGMNQFKPIFLGTSNPGDERSKLRLAANSQKCIRAGGKHNDLEAVGRDGTHHTFFGKFKSYQFMPDNLENFFPEMLGNWGFNGSLPKQAACQHALTLLTDIYGLSKDRLFVTYFKGDEQLGISPDLECREAWRQLGFVDDRIVALGADDNFWEMGQIGPCGPCTEILYSSADPPSFQKSMEIWNLVFISYNRMPDGRLNPLPSMHVDTGMGLERLCTVLQDVKTTYETDLFQPLLEFIRNRTGAEKYGNRFGDHDQNGIDTHYRILADHARMFTIAIADGVVPSARDASKILRKVLRNASYQATLISSKVPRKQRGKLRLADLSNVVADSLGDAYPELRSNLDRVREVVEEEQSFFDDRLWKGKKRLGILFTAKGDRATADDLIEIRVKYTLPMEEIWALMKRRGITLDEAIMGRVAVFEEVRPFRYFIFV